MKPIPVLPGLWKFEDTCHVYVLKDGDRAMAVDFGSGAWLPHLKSLGVSRLEHVFLTHGHADQCAGLTKRKKWPFVIHAPVGEERFLDPANVRALKRSSGPGADHSSFFPPTYHPLERGVPGISYDMYGFMYLFWGTRRIRFIHTPGHGPHALSITMDIAGKQVVFCGDAVHAGGTVWEPYNLEWDHWTGTGALAAWEGIKRLEGTGVECLCPSHGPVITEKSRAVLTMLAGRLMTFYLAKGQISPGERDRYVEPMETDGGIRHILPSLYLMWGNAYLLCSVTGQALVIDPYKEDIPHLERLLKKLRLVPTAAVVSHFHADHCDGFPYLRKHHGTRLVLHPLIAEPLAALNKYDIPYSPPFPLGADELWPNRGTWQWNEYTFRVAPWPGQTAGHTVFMTDIDGKRVVFAGDSFTPASRWNGTGGFCAYNYSRFREGYIPSARLLLEWKPEIVAAGHTNCYRFAASKFRKIIAWAKSAEKAVRALCPSGDMKKDYYPAGQVLPPGWRK